MSVRLVMVLAVLAACRFDETGLPSPLSGDAAVGDGHHADATTDPITDAAGSDAATPCVDLDGDDFLAQGSPGVDCGEPLDCDDGDPDAYPGQPDGFTEARLSGGFDYDCDGVETPTLDTAAGADCYWDWFTCKGTGWYGGVPACGQQGIWHTCSVNGIRCEESDAQLLIMSCR